MTTTNPTARERAERIVEKMFTNGAGQKADRLVLMKQGHRPKDDRDLGGWHKAALVDLIAAEIESEGK